MYIQYDNQSYWLLEGTADEFAAIVSIPKRKLFFERVRNWLFLLPAGISIVLSLGAIVLIDSNEQSNKLALVLTIPFLLGVIACVVFMLRYDYRRPFLQLQAEDRLIDYHRNVSWQVFLTLLFTGERKLEELENQYLALDMVEHKLIDEFWRDKRNREVLYRLSQHSSGEAGTLARQVLIGQMQEIADAITPHVAPLRKLELLAKENATARKTKEELDAYADLCVYLQSVGLLPKE